MKYCQATNTGKGFITHADRELAHLSGHPGDIWAVGEVNAAWIGRVAGVEKSLEEATAIALAASQAGWDSNTQPDETAEQKIERLGQRPVAVELPV
jgi:hypothetical protein